MTKFYIGKIEEYVGEYEFRSTFRFKLDEGKSPTEYLDNLARDWRLSNTEWSPYLGGYDHGGVAVNSGDYYEIDEVTYKGLAGAIVQL